MIPTAPFQSVSAIRPKPRPNSKSTFARVKVKENTMLKYRDTSLSSGTRAKEEEDHKLLKAQQSLDKQSEIFANEVRKLKDKQGQLARNQYKMALTAMKKYSVYLIQALYRGYYARKLCKQIRSIRLLSVYLGRRWRWRKRTRAAHVIILAYKRYVLFQRLQRYHTLCKMATRIQRNYRSHFLFKRAVLRRFALTTWKHVQLFGICRATHVVCPMAKHKRVIFRGLTHFYRRLRRKRMEIAFNSYRVFYGLFFAESPVAKKRIMSRASSLVNKRRSTAGKKRQSVFGVELSLSTYRIDNATKFVRKHEDNDATHDMLRYLRSKVMADQMKKFRQKKQNAPVPPSVSQRSNGSMVNAPIFTSDVVASRRQGSLGSPTPPSSLLSQHRATLSSSPGPPLSSPVSLHHKSIMKPNFPVSSLSERFTQNRRSFGINNNKVPTNNKSRSGHALKILGSIEEGARLKAELPTNLPTFDEVFNDYVMPKRLMKYRSTSQIDSNSMFANLKTDETDKLVPFELRGNYRLKTLADTVLYIQDLFQIAVQNPLVLQNPFDRKPANQDLLIPEKRDRSPRFIETHLPFNGTFQYSIFRRGGVSYDFENSAVYNKLSDLKLSSGKRALLRQHVIKSSAVKCEEERFHRRHFMNPMRKDQPQMPVNDIDTLDLIFLENFEKSESKKQKKRRNRLVKPTEGDSGLRAQENLIRDKILKMREEILQQQELINALKGSHDESDEDSDSDTSTSSASSSSGGEMSADEGESVDSGDDDEDEASNEMDHFPSHQHASSPTTPAPSFRFQRRTNVNLLSLTDL